MSRIPDISDERLKELAARIKPVVRFTTDDKFSIGTSPKERSSDSNGRLFYIEPVDPRQAAFTWDPKPVGPPADNLRKLDIIRTYHSWGAPSMFKPSVAEVLAQLSPTQVEEAVAFEVVCDDKDARHVLSDGFHASLTILYTDKPHAP